MIKMNKTVASGLVAGSIVNFNST